MPLTLDVTANYISTVPKRDGNVALQQSIGLHHNQVINYKHGGVSVAMTLPHFNLNRGRQHFVQCIYKYTTNMSNAIILHITTPNTTNVKQQVDELAAKDVQIIL